MITSTRRPDFMVGLNKKKNFETDIQK